MHLLNVLQHCFPLRNMYLHTSSILACESHQQFTVGTERRGNTVLMPEYWISLEYFSCVLRSKLCPLICGAQSHTRSDPKPSKEISLDTAKNQQKQQHILEYHNLCVRTWKRHGGPDLVRPSWVHLALSRVLGRYQKFRAMVQNGAAVSIIA